MCIQSLTTILTTIIAILVAIITGGQWITNRARLRHELFDRRYAMYETIASFLAEIAIHGAVQESADRKFLIATNKAYFVFGCDKHVKDLVSKIYRLAVELDGLHRELESLPVGKQRSANVQHQTKIKAELQNIFSSLEGRFEKYLRLDH